MYTEIGLLGGNVVDERYDRECRKRAKKINMCE